MNVHIHDFLPESETVLWDLWYPEAGATGVPIARGRLNPRSPRSCAAVDGDDERA